jgi:hypothetical protein
MEVFDSPISPSNTVSALAQQATFGLLDPIRKLNFSVVGAIIEALPNVGPRIAGYPPHQYKPRLRVQQTE